MYKKVLLSIIFSFLFGVSWSQNDSIHTLKLLFAGDIMGHDSQIKSAEIELNKSYDYSSCFEYIAPVLKDADLTIGNLELTFPGKPPYTGYPLFKSPEDLALALRHAGFNFLATANNHSNDGGLIGVTNTVETLDEYGFYHTGTFKNAEEREAYYPLIVYKGNFKLAFLNYTYDTNGVPTRFPTIVNEIKEELIEADMAVARDLQPDAIIVIMHWGEEYQLTESKKQRDLAQKLANWGADLIIGAHPHVVQPIKNVTTLRADSTEKIVPVAYSLGNFISGQVKVNTDGGLMVEIILKKNTIDNSLQIKTPQYIPVWRWREKTKDGKTNYRVIPISAYEEDATSIGMNATDHTAMLRYVRAVRKNLENSEASEKKISLQPATSNE
ncbi:MAG: CapA family protein [Saprospiraceae bacterium]|nr:CapA family protein [Saprospiraceae bacterium]